MVSRRQHGRNVEKCYVRVLAQNLPAGWTVTQGLGHPSFGDVDALVTAGDGERFVVEIKSFGGMMVDPWGILLKSNGGPVRKDIIRQVQDQVRFARARQGLVWLPRAKTDRVFVHRGVTFVNGSVLQLLQVMCHRIVGLRPRVIAETPAKLAGVAFKGRGRRMARRVLCEVETVDLDNERGTTTEGVRVTCGQCGYQTESFGTTERSIRRCLALLGRECPDASVGENYYVSEED